MGLTLSGLGTILSGVNFVTTIICMRAPGMTMFRMPIFTWNVLDSRRLQGLFGPETQGRNRLPGKPSCPWEMSKAL